MSGKIYALCGYLYSEYVEQESIICVSETRELLVKRAASLKDPYADTQTERNRFVDSSAMHTFIIEIENLKLPNLPALVPATSETDTDDNQDDSCNYRFRWSYMSHTLKFYKGFYTKLELGGVIRDDIILINKFWFLPNKKISFDRIPTDNTNWRASNACLSLLEELTEYFNK